MNNWTKEPWIVKNSEHDPSGLEIIIGDEQRFYVVRQATNLNSDNYKERTANAHLISAAPDMADALEAMIYAHTAGDGRDIVMAHEAAKLALEKAKGEV